jgi:hypothetical protein
MEMGTVINFPAVARTARAPRAAAGKAPSATVIILPVIRIERYAEAPAGYSLMELSSMQRRRRRRRSSRA